MKKTVFYNFYKNLEDENVLHDDRKHQIPFFTPFIEQKRILIVHPHYIVLRLHLNYYMLM